ncbi:MAG: hypothetical protein POELPBGB_01628 [Bacteroidia bacterium]|nr:hypothetical protein [Bacteroidia bacterium]
MKRLLYCLVAGLFLPISLVAQCPNEWVQQISGLPSGNLANVSPSMVVDHFGNVIVSNVVVGADTIMADGQIFPETYSFNPNSDFFLAKYNGMGSLLWLKTIIGEHDCGSLDMTVDHNGNIYVGGLMTNSITVEGIAYERPGATQLGFFIMKLSPSGDLQWLQKSDFNGSRCYSLYWTGEDLAFTIPFTDSVEVDGQVYYADVPVNPSYQDILFGKLSADGELLSAFHIGGIGNVDVKALVCDESGYLLQGQFDLELTFDGTTLTTPAQDHYSLYQLAVSNEGVLLWSHKSINGSDLYVLPHGMGLTNGDKVVFSGVYDYSNLTIDGITIGNTAARDVFVGELNRSDGSVNWLKKAIGSQTDYTETLVSRGDNSWLGGYFYSSQFEYEGFQLTNTNDGEYDGYVVSIDNDGKSRCGIGFPGNGQEAVRSIQITDNFQLLVLASFNNTIEVNGQTYTAQGNYDLLVIKTCLPCDTLTSITETTAAQPTLHIYPNPASQSVRVEVQGSMFKVQSITITDMLGHTVIHQKTTNHENNIHISHLANGLYTVATTLHNGETQRQKLVVQH